MTREGFLRYHRLGADHVFELFLYSCASYHIIPFISIIIIIINALLNLFDSMIPRLSYPSFPLSTCLPVSLPHDPISRAFSLKFSASPFHLPT